MSKMPPSGPTTGVAIELLSVSISKLVKTVKSMRSNDYVAYDSLTYNTYIY